MTESRVQEGIRSARNRVKNAPADAAGKTHEVAADVQGRGATKTSTRQNAGEGIQDELPSESGAGPLVVTAGADNVGSKAAVSIRQIAARARRRFKSAPPETSEHVAQCAVEQVEQSVRHRQRVRPETRAEMLDRLTNPTISLHEASVILGVCAATIRRYTNANVLPHERTAGGQRRFRLRDVLLLRREFESKRKVR